MERDFIEAFGGSFMPVEPVTLRWTINGSLVGFLITWLDMFLEWRDMQFAAWSGSGISYNLGLFGGAIAVGALIGSIAGAIRDNKKRRAGLLVVVGKGSTATTASRFEYDQSVGAVGRLGQVLYWAGLGIGVILIAGALAALAFGRIDESGPLAVMLGLCAVCSMLIGLAFRYIFTGPKPRIAAAARPTDSRRPIWKNVLVVAVVATLLALGRYLLDQSWNSQPGLWGNARKSFVSGAASSCGRTQSQMPENKGITPVEIRNYCSCVANKLANSLTLNEVREGEGMSKEQTRVHFQTRHKELMEASSTSCAEIHVKPRLGSLFTGRGIFGPPIFPADERHC